MEVSLCEWMLQPHLPASHSQGSTLAEKSPGADLTASKHAQLPAVCLSVLGNTSTAQCCEGGSHHRFISVRSLPVLLGPPLPDKQPCRAVHHPFERPHRFTQQNQKTNWQPWISLNKGPSRVNTKAIPTLKNLSPPPCRSYCKLL